MISPCVLILALLGHGRHAVRESATKHIISIENRDLARWAMRSRDPEVRRRGERIEREIVARKTVRCFPTDYPVWPCIDFLAGVWIGGSQVIPSRNEFPWVMVRHHLGHAKYYGRFNALYPEYRMATMRWVEECIRDGVDDWAVRMTVSEMVRRERIWMRSSSIRWPPPVVLASDGVGIVGVTVFPWGM